MAASPISLSVSPVNLDVAPLKGTGGGNVDNFLALLNTVDTKPSGGTDFSVPYQPSERDESQPQAAAIDAPAPIEDVRRPAPANDDQPAAKPVAQQDAPQEARADHSSPSPHDKAQAEKAPAPVPLKSRPHLARPDAPGKTQPAVSDAAVDASNPAAEQTGDQLRAALQDQLGNIGQILLALIEALSRGAAAPVAGDSPIASDATVSGNMAAATMAGALTISATIPGTVAPAVAVSPGLTPATVTPGILAPAIATESLLAQLTAAMDAGVEPAPSNAALPDAVKNLTTNAGAALPAVTLLKDIQSLVRQLQQALQPAAPSPQPSTDVAVAAAPPLPVIAESNPTPDRLQALTDVLSRSVATFSQLLGLQPVVETPDIAVVSSGVIPPSPLPLPSVTPANAVAQPALAAATASEAGNLGAFLKQGIAQVRDQLQKLREVNETLFTQAKDTLQSQFQAQLSTGQAVKDDAAAENMQLKDVAARITQAFVASSAAAQVPNVQAVSAEAPVPTASNNITGIAAAAVTIVQASADTSGGNSSGNNGQQQSAPAPVVAASASQPQNTGQVAGSAFARALNQADTLRAPVAEQIAFQVKTAIADGSSKIRIQLDPADLGKLDIRLNVSAEGKTGVVITVDNKTTLALLQQDAAGLTRALNDAGLSTDSGSLSFNLRGGQQDNGRGANPQAAASYQSAQPEPEEPILPDVITRSYVVNLAEGLDISI